MVAIFKAPVSMVARDWLAGLPGPLLQRWPWLLALVVLLGVANLPWHLDNYDQAKQAWAAYEMAQGGDWWFQHTPRGKLATKPPAMGWMSAIVYRVGVPWDWAWRWPSFAAALALLIFMARAGEKLWPQAGGFLAVCALGFNMLTPRLAGLVRTDMLLTLWIVICGLLIWEKVESGKGWCWRSRLAFAAAMTGALFTKGPVIYVFLVPGMIAYWFLVPRNQRAAICSGWLPWLLPLALFLAWGVAGLLTRPEFYEQIVVRELFSRFDQSLKSHEKQQPFWFYFPHLFHKLMPWSVLLLGITALSANARRAVRERPQLLWLACWALGGLLLMTLVPSKRVDRIFPVVPPLVLLFVGMASACQCGARIRAWCGAAILAGAIIWGAYFAALVWLGIREDARGLVRFGERVRQSGEGGLVIVAGRDEGLAIYAGAKGFVPAVEALRRFRHGESLVVAERLLAEPRFEGLRAEDAEFSSGIRPSGENYLFFQGGGKAR